MNFPNHACSLTLQHNEHKDFYQTTLEYLENDKHVQFESEESKQRCIDTNELWTLTWYPDTPIGSHSVGAATLDECLNFANQYEK